MTTSWAQTVTLIVSLTGIVGALTGGLFLWSDSKHEKFAEEHVKIYQAFADIEAESRLVRARVTCGGISRAEFLDWLLLLQDVSDHEIPKIPPLIGGCGITP